MTYAKEVLSNAVLAIYPDIEERAALGPKVPSEKELWQELSCCLLSSQVSYSMAQAAAKAVCDQCLMDSPYCENLVDKLELTLRTKVFLSGQQRSYRFPASRAKQLASTRRLIGEKFGSLTTMLDSFEEPSSARRWLVDNAPGIGPKQASMFLRNVGFSYDLAIIDRHVLNYMIAMGLVVGNEESPYRLKDYLRQESLLQDYANDIGAKIGFLDWAIWIVMRVKDRPITSQFSFEWV